MNPKLLSPAPMQSFSDHVPLMFWVQSTMVGDKGLIIGGDPVPDRRRLPFDTSLR
jgi:hypothetical protein